MGSYMLVMEIVYKVLIEAFHVISHMITFGEKYYTPFRMHGDRDLLKLNVKGVDSQFPPFQRISYQWQCVNSLVEIYLSSTSKSQQIHQG